MESRMGVGNLSNGSFPKKLFTLLHEEDSTIIGFLHGKYFKILDAARFASEVLPKYYRHQKVESFQRQLNMYGFRRISRGDMSGAYYHPMLRQDREDLVPYIGKDILQDRNKQQELIAFGTERFKSKRTRASMTSVESSISSAGSVISLPNETTSEPKPLVADVKIETGDQNSSEDRGVINAPGATESDFDSIFGFCDSPNDLKGADCREQDYKEEIEPKLENKKRKNVVDLLDERLTRLL